jgi:aldehyde dehydrogenase (NAD+)
VFAGRRSAGYEIARRVRSGMTSVNGVITFATVPALPFGGIGRVRLRPHPRRRRPARVHPAKAITRQRFALPVALTSFDRPEKVTGQLVKMVKLLHGRG